MMVDPDRAAGHVDHNGQTYYFCSKGCVAKFTADPEKYLSGKREPMHAPAVVHIGGLKKPSPEPGAPSSEPRASRWTCPMDPEVESDRPGSCPKCGMALEPMVDDLSKAEIDTPNPELVDMTRRFWIALVLATPVFLLTMGDMATGGALMHRLGTTRVNWAELVLATPVVLWCGWPFYQRMWASFVNASPNMFTLIGIGTGAAFLYSAVATLAPGLFPERFRTHGGVDTYFDTAVVITVLVLLGQVLELRARHRTGAAIRQLLGLAPKTARLVRDGREEDIAVDAVQRGDALRVRPGDKVPVVGVLADGVAALDGVNGDVLLLSVAHESGRLRRETQELPNRRAGPVPRAQLEHLAEQHEHRDDDGRIEVRVDASMRPETFRKQTRRQRRDGAVEKRRAGPDADQREHVRARVDERGPHALVERPAAPQDDRRRQHELRPIHSRRAQPMHQRSACRHVAHRQQEDRCGQAKSDPEPRVMSTSSGFGVSN